MKLFLTTLFSLGLLTAPMAMMPVAVNAQADLCLEQPDVYGETEFCKNRSTDSDTNPVLGTISTVVDIVALIAGVAAVIMVIIGGFKYVTSSGDPNTTTSARNTIIYSLVGLIVTILARFIVIFVLELIN